MNCERHGDARFCADCYRPRSEGADFLNWKPRRPIRAVAVRSAPHNKRSRPFPGLAEIVHELKLTRAQAVVAGKVYAAITGKLAGVT